jgi:acetylornithine/succinyldiaminopimelate/putrescine aminotransferase
VQCGVGRSGHLFAYEYFGVEPDVVALAKGLAGGVPIGAMLARDKFAAAFRPGDHASTFGGNPLAAAAGCAVLDQVLPLLPGVRAAGEYLGQVLDGLLAKHQAITATRGIGLMRCIELDRPAAPYIDRCIEDGLLLISSGANVIRFVPPLIVEKKHIDQMAEILDNALSDS